MYIMPNDFTDELDALLDKRQIPMHGASCADDAIGAMYDLIDIAMSEGLTHMIAPLTKCIAECKNIQGEFNYQIELIDEEYDEINEKQGEFTQMEAISINYDAFRAIYG